MLLPVAILTFALASLLWSGVSFAVLAQGIADGSMRDQAHVVVGSAVAALEAAIVVGWLWALFASARTGSPVNGPAQAMCGATAAVQVAFALAFVVLMGGWLWDGPSGYLLGHAVIAGLLAVLIHRARRRRVSAGAG